MKIYFRIQDKKDRCFGACGLYSTHWWDIFIFLWFFEIEFFGGAKDWMVKGKDEVHGDKTYSCWIRNPRYVNEQAKHFIWPKNGR